MVGAVLTLVVCSFFPLGAQSQSDANFDEITCTGLNVVDSSGKVKGSISILGEACIVRVGDLNKPGVVLLGGWKKAFVDVVGNDHKTRGV